MESVLNFLTNINVIFTLLGYLIGGIPFGYALMKIFYGMDITKIGSGGIGATNVLRALQSKGVSNAKQMALLVLILDLFKGMFAVFLSKWFGLDYSLQWMVAIASILGHCYSPFLNFNGGKGVSTIMGSVVLLIPIESLIGLVVWFFVGKVLKISSLASILGVGTATVLIFFVPYMHIPDIPDSVNILKEVGTQTPMVLIFIFTLIKHAGNIFNLLAGKEKKVL
ncbi:glycerol-3-phosphate 1-O-acyltransferase PlsY [Helicobacter pylori]